LKAVAVAVNRPNSSEMLLLLAYNKKTNSGFNMGKTVQIILSKSSYYIPIPMIFP
jgi:hypothetical protein